MDRLHLVESDRSSADRLPFRRVRFGVASRIILLVVGFVILAEVAIFVPAVTNFRNSWLRDRLSSAYTAALVFDAAPAELVPEDLAGMILASVGARTIVLKTATTRRLLAASQMPPKIDESYDLRAPTFWTSAPAALRTLIVPEGRILNVVGNAPRGADFIEITLEETPLREAMQAYALTLAAVSLGISVMVAALGVLAIDLMVLRPLRRLTSNITAFGADPENAAHVVEPSGRTHEIGVAEDALARMQTTLVRELTQKKHLAALGLAVAKVNHDLRNILASAQLLSDRMIESSDPVARRLAPKLVATLDRAIAFCQSTLTYGRAIEKAPKLAALSLRSVVGEAIETVAPLGSPSILFLNDVPLGLTVQADAEQLYRVLLNLCRNAVDALEHAGAQPGREPAVRISARRDGLMIVLDVADSGPGVPARAREHLFEAFQGVGKIGGAGLGLAIASDLVRAHGGQIALVDAPEVETLGGAVFRIVLPARATRGRATVEARLARAAGGHK